MRKKNIYIPHLHYTVRVRQIVKAPNEISNALAYVENDDKNGCTVYLDLKHRVEAADLAHELTHVLQFICLARNIQFTLEQEHMGYIMHYLFGQILGQKWI